jgi:pyroglutamyl-peptidase
MKVLVTGFEPFGGESINPSWEAVRMLPDVIEGSTLIKIQLPVVQNKALERIHETIRKEQPDCVLSVGQAGGRKGITVERIGINCDDYRIADNEGNQPVDEKIFADGPDAYFASIPVRKIVEAINREGIEVSVSNTAGTYVCNHVLYGTRYLCEKEYGNIISGFIHVPYIREQEKEPNMDLADIAKALEIALKVIVKK